METTDVWMKDFIQGPIGSYVTSKHRSAYNHDRRTPIELFKQIDEEFNFQLDPCTSSSKHGNLETPRYYTKKEDGLMQDWWPHSPAFVNPPFDNIGPWLRKAHFESRRGCTCVVLVPSKTDTAWWHDLVLEKADEIRYIRGRVKFEGFEQAFIFGCAMVIYYARTENGEIVYPKSKNNRRRPF